MDRLHRGYLLILVGAVFISTLPLPFMNIFRTGFINLSFFGIIFVAYGIKQVSGTQEELKRAYFSAFAMVVIPFILAVLVHLRLPIPFLGQLFVILRTFAYFSIYFWLFKADYMLSPSAEARTDLFLYSIASVAYLMFHLALTFPILRLIPISFELHLGISLAFYAVLFFALTKRMMNRY